MTLNEMLNYGALVDHDDDTGVYITVNKIYFTYWVRTGPDAFENTDVWSFDSYSDLRIVPLGVLQSLARSFITDNDSDAQERIAQAKEGN